MTIPTQVEIRALHEKHAPTREAFDLVYTHCRIVWQIAEQILVATGLDLNTDLVRAGALLHDIGVYRLYDADGHLDHARYVRHGILGEELLGEEGIAPAVRRFCSHHTGMGLTRADIQEQGLPMPAADFLAESVEEELVMYADKFHSKTTPPVFVRGTTYAASVARFGEVKVATFERLQKVFGNPDLSPLIAAYGHALI